MRWLLWILSAAIAFGLASLLFPRLSARPSASAEPHDVRLTDLSGPAQVIDGDSIHVGGVEVRLHGVDAVEGAQTCIAERVRWPCGRRAAQALRRLVDGRTVACDERDRDQYGRVVAVCRTDGTDINEWLVANGWALAYRRHASTYIAAESAAKSDRRGIWRGDFVAPWDWRQADRRGRETIAGRDRATAATAPQQTHCNIKGNISYNSGKRLYHRPGDPDYADTRISAARGERWFCSEAEARRAGWRRAVR